MFRKVYTFFFRKAYKGKIEDEKIDRSLRFSFFDGFFVSGMMGFTQDFFAPFLLLLGGTIKEIGILNAVPNLVASLIQMKSPDLVEKIKSRKMIITNFVFLQALVLLPIIFVALSGGINPMLFISIVVLFLSLGNLTIPAWGSLMSDLVPEDKRGEYFGWRNQVLGFITIILTFAAGFILQLTKPINIFYGFAAIFSLAFIFRIFSWLSLVQVHEPPLVYNREDRFNIIDFILRIKESNFAKFVLFVAMMSFSVNLAAPFFVVLMLKDLHFGYLTFTVINITGTLAIYLMMGRWGRLSDRIGNLKIIKFVSPLMGIVPLLWIANNSPLFLFFAQVISGFVWAGFNICVSNFVYDSVTPAKRTRCIAYFNVFNGVALCLGALMGGFLVDKLPPLGGYKILSLFLVSAVLRIIVGIIMPMQLKEVRPVEKINSKDMFYNVIGIKPLLGIAKKAIGY
jgi:MFS family permease